MIAIIIAIIILVAIGVLVYKKSNYDKIYNSISAILASFLILIIPTITIFVPMTGGFCPGYGYAEQSGYLTQFGQRGLIWKTYEGEIQKGVGEQASAEEAFEFSTNDPEIAKKLIPYLGTRQRIKVECKVWCIAPFSVGWSDNQIVDVVIIEDGESE